MEWRVSEWGASRSKEKLKEARRLWNPSRVWEKAETPMLKFLFLQCLYFIFAVRYDMGNANQYQPLIQIGLIYALRSTHQRLHFEMLAWSWFFNFSSTCASGVRWYHAAFPARVSGVAGFKWMPYNMEWKILFLVYFSLRAVPVPVPVVPLL